MPPSPPSGEARILRRYASDAVKSGSSDEEGSTHVYHLTFVFPVLFSPLPLMPKTFKLCNQISDSCLTKCSYSINTLKAMNENKELLES